MGLRSCSRPGSRAGYETEKAQTKNGAGGGPADKAEERTCTQGRGMPANATSFQSTYYVASIQIDATRAKLSSPVNRFGLKKDLESLWLN